MIVGSNILRDYLGLGSQAMAIWRFSCAMIMDRMCVCSGGVLAEGFGGILPVTLPMKLCTRTTVRSVTQTLVHLHDEQFLCS